LKAIVLKEFGGPEVLRLEDVPTPRPADGEILLQVHSVSVNRTLDLIVRAGKYPVKVRLPHVLGADPAGEVVAIGAGVANGVGHVALAAARWDYFPGLLTAPLCFAAGVALLRSIWRRVLD